MVDLAAIVALHLSPSAVSVEIVPYSHYPAGRWVRFTQNCIPLIALDMAKLN
jgi:hypothetical protein